MEARKHQSGLDNEDQPCAPCKDRDFHYMGYTKLEDATLKITLKLIGIDPKADDAAIAKRAMRIARLLFNESE